MTAARGPLAAWAWSDERLGAGTSGPVPLLDRPGWRALRADATGLVVATLFALLAMTPSILPRNWVFQPVVSGVSAAAGYGVGVGLGWLLRRTGVYRRTAAPIRRRAPRLPRRAWAARLVAVPTSLVVVLVVASDWQRQTAARVGMEPETSAGWLRAAPLIVVLAATIVAAVRGLRLVARGISALLRRWIRLPRGVAQGVAAVAVVLLTVGIVDGVVLRWALTAADTSFSVGHELLAVGAERLPRGQ
ncbi:alpha/beta-hydrolase N-terminal domain-containing protein [Blastococcus sp. SYSU DS0539]